MRTMRLFGIEQEFGERLAQLGLADAGRAEEQERAVGPIRIGQAGARAADRIGHRRTASSWPTTRCAERLFHAQQLFLLAFEHLGDGNAGPLGHDFGDLLVGHLVTQQLACRCCSAAVACARRRSSSGILPYCSSDMRCEILRAPRRFQFELARAPALP